MFRRRFTAIENLKFIISQPFALPNIPRIGSVMAFQMSNFEMRIEDLH